MCNAVLHFKSYRQPHPPPTTCRLSSSPMTKPDQSCLHNEESIKKNLAKGDPRLWKRRCQGYAEWCSPTPWQGRSCVQGFQTPHTALYLSVHRHPLKSVLFTCNAVNEQKFSNKHKVVSPHSASSSSKLANPEKRVVDSWIWAACHHTGNNPEPATGVKGEQPCGTQPWAGRIWNYLPAAWQDGMELMGTCRSLLEIFAAECCAELVWETGKNTFLCFP